MPESVGSQAAPVTRTPAALVPSVPARRPLPETQKQPPAGLGEALVAGAGPLTPPGAFEPALDALRGVPAEQAGLIAGLQSGFGNRFTGAVLQRKCECGGSCASCEKKKDEENKNVIQRQAATPGPLPGEVAAPMTQSEDQPLPSDLQKHMESRFGADFSDVRVHADSPASQAAKALNARAFTSGRDIYFGPGQYSPETITGRQLIAHELAHVVQQTGGAVKPAAQRMTVSEPGDFFEAEADRAADSVMRGERPAVTGAPSGVLSRKKGDPPKPGEGDILYLPAGDALDVPGEKGNGQVRTEYNRALADKRLSTLAKHTRPGTDTLRRIWKTKTGWKGDVKDFTDKFSVDGVACEVDHIVELQVGGTNNAENLQLLEKSNNASSGSQIKSQVAALTTKYPGKVLRFTKVKYGKAVADKCKAKERKIKEGEAGDNIITLIFGSRPIEIDLGDKADKTKVSTYDVSGRRYEIVAGLRFSTLTYSEDSKGKPAAGSKLDAAISSAVKTFVKDKSQQNVTLDVAADRSVNLSAKNKVLDLLFPFLSEAKFNAAIDDAGFAGTGKFSPSIPILNKSEVNIKVESGKFSGSLKVAPEQVNVPIPGVTVTESSIEAALEDSKFSATGKLGFKIGAFATVALEAKGSAKAGFSATGTVDFMVPGLDTAQGKVKYEKDKLSGQVRIGKDKFKLPGVKSAHLTVDITDAEVTGSGEVALDVPGVKKGTLAFGVDKAGNYSITGAASLAVPGLKEAEISLTLADGDLSGSAKVGLDIPGLEGAGAAFEIRYSKGLITGSGEIEYKKGKLSGKVHAELTEKHKLTGGGELAYEIVPGLVAAVGIEIHEDGTAKISGELRIPATIDLFPEKAYDKTLFSYSLQIPLFAIPVGPRSVGLVAEIGANLKARAGIGPGQIRKAKILASFDPSNDESAFEFQAAGELYVPAFAELSLGIYGGIGLSIVIASATGGIELKGSFGLRGELLAAVNIAYKEGQFAVDAKAEVTAQPVLKFDINAYVKVDVSLIFTTIEVYRKDWNLASKEWGSGLKIGLRFPVHYVFGQPFELSLDQVEFIKPEIDVKQAIKDLLPM